MLRRVAVRAIIELDGKLLCVKQKPYNEVSATMANSWATPGGGLNDGEPLIQGLEREVYEELGVKSKVGGLVYIQQFIYNEKEHLEFFFKVNNPEDFLSIDLNKTSHGAAEIEKAEFVVPSETNILPTFLTKDGVIEKINSNTAPEVFSYI